ncbi:hypothetical protein COCON_G00093260 [Conger conger]|uniref:Vitellogenin domain-containing protein n=1 Tax=Conger conger TaxID=82655 RepID=A0A9Q1I0D3_CONCO|nr:hypothetical protein COCON_G00093260 [Conger conger]
MDREALERNALLFSIREGKVLEVCPQAGEVAWTLNIKRAILSVLQTSHTGETQEMVEETDIHGTCWSSYERRGPLLVKTRNLQRCFQDRLADFWVHSVPLTDTTQATLFLRLVFQLRGLSRDQLQELWQEASFKCRDDWQPLLDALPTCGSEACVSIMTDLILGGEVEEERVSSFLSSFAFIPRPTPTMIRYISTLLQSPEAGSGTLLAASAVVHSFCQRARSPCSLFPEVQQFMDILMGMLGEDCKEGITSQLTEKLRVLKAVGNAGLAASSFTSVLSACAQSVSSPLELRLAAINAFRRIHCSANRKALLQLYCSAQEDVEVRIAAYQQLMHCPDLQVLRKVRATLRTETSSQVGAFVWSHLTHIQKTEDPLKQALMELLPDDIISKDFEAESWKYSSYIDATMDTGFGGANMEGALVFSPSSLFPRSAMANLTLHILGRAFNLLEVNFRAENMEPLLKQVFGQQAPQSEEEAGLSGAPERQSKSGEAGKEANGSQDKKERGCQSDGSTRLRQAKAKFAGRRSGDTRLWCGLSVKLFGNELDFITCDDISAQMRQLSLSLAGVAVRLLKGQELQLNHRAVLATEELVLPSLSGLPVKLALNMSTSLSLRVKGSANLVNWSHFSVSGYIKPSAYVGVWARMGVEGPCGLAGVEWAMGLRTSTSLDGAIQLQKGQDLRVTLNTPEDIMDIFHFSSRIYSVNAEVREELTDFRDRVEKTICTPHDWSKLVGWQLCSQASYPVSRLGVALPPAGPALLSLRMLKLDRGLHQYLLEASYSLLSQRGTWVPLEAYLHLFLGTPQSSVPRDVALDLSFSSVTPKLTLKVTHPLKSFHIQGQADQFRGMRSGKVELLVDNLNHYYIKGLMDMQILPTEQRLLSHLEAKITTDGHPIVLSFNVTRGMGRKIMLLDLRMEEGHRQYNTEAELLLPGLLGGQIIGLLQHRGPLWTTNLRLRYGLQGDTQNQRQECHMTQNLKNERDSRKIYRLWAKHELYCSHITTFNHKVQLRHEEGPGHIQSALDLSYGKHWNEINNKRRVLLSQAFKNQSRHALTSYLLEFSLQVLEKHMNYKTQLLHSHLHQRGAESSTHLKVIYNDQMPLVVGLHWKDSSKSLVQKWEGSFNMDTPWLYVYTAHKLSQPQRHTFNLKSEITTRKLVNLRNLVLEGFYRTKSKEREGLLHVYNPVGTYLKASGRGLVGKKGLKVSSSLSSAWTSALQGDIMVENSRHQKALQLVASYGKQNISLFSALSTTDKKLKKRLVMLKLVLSEPRSPAVELELEGVVEELKRNSNLYQKQGRLHLRQPFRHFPQSLVLQETFSVDLRQARYVLESKAILSGSKESVHTLTLGYKPASLFVCSSLTHPYGSEVIPQDSELCIRLHSNQLLLCLNNRCRPSKSLEGQLSWTPSDSPEFDYLAVGRAVINHIEKSRFSVQLNGSSNVLGLYSSFSHPFNFTPKKFQAHAEAELSGEGGVHSSVRVKVDGEDRATLEANLFNTQRNTTKVLGAKVALRQRLLPLVQDTELQLSANISTDRLSALLALTQEGSGTLDVRLGGAVEHSPGLWLRVSGALQNSLPHLKVLPPALRLTGVLRQSPRLTEGELKVTVRDAVYGVELNQQGTAGPGQEGTLGEKKAWARDFLCVYTAEEALCVDISSILETWQAGRLHALLSHTSPKLYTAGLAYNSSVQLSWIQEERRLSAAVELQRGARGLRTTVEGLRSGQEAGRWELSSSIQHNIPFLQGRGVLCSAAAAGHYQVDTGVVSAGVVVHMDEQRTLEVLLEVGRTDVSARLALSLQHHMWQLEGVVPSLFKMNCTGGVTADRLSGQCSGNAAGRSVERAGVPMHMALSGLLSATPCQSVLSCNVSVEREGLSLSVGHQWKPTASLSAILTHSFTQLRNRGLPLESSLSLSASGGPGQSRVMVLRAGPCWIRACGDTRPGERSQWVWVAETRCPLLEDFSLPAQAQVNGSLVLDGCVLDAGWTGCGSGLQVEVMTTGGLTGHSRLLVTGNAGPRQCQGELELQLGDCALRASVGLQSHDLLQGSALLQNNCTTLQRQQETLVNITHSVPLLLSCGVPANATLSISSERGQDHYHQVLSCSLDSKQISQVVRVKRSQAELRGQYLLSHTLDSLRYWGVPENNSIQAEAALGEVKSLVLCLQFGAGLTSLNATLRGTPLDVEVAGTLQHSLPWLQQLGLPKAVEAVCIVHGALPQLHSTAGLSVEGEVLLLSALNISAVEGHLDVRLSLGTPSLTVGLPHTLNTTLTAEYTGVQKRVSADVHCDGRQVHVAGEVSGWGTHKRDIKAVIEENTEGEDSPMLQLEVWGKLTESQLSGSLAVNLESNSSLTLTVQWHNLPNRKEFDVRLCQSIPGLQHYLPSHLGTQTQLNHSSSGLQGAAELQLGLGELRVRGDLARTKTGYNQALELDHSFLQLKPIPKNVEVRITYDADNHNHRLQKHVLWGGQDLKVSGQYNAPPDQEKGTNRLRAHRRLDRVRPDWRGHSSDQQLKTVLPLVDFQGCGTVARERNSYSQMAELNWGSKRITQSMKYQRGAGGTHTLQLEGRAENVLPSPCPSHTLLAQVHTDCKNQLEHHLLLGLCPQHPTWAVSGHHRVNTGKELFYTQTRLSVLGEPQQSSFTLVLTNTSTAQRTNFSLQTRFQVGDGSLDLGSSATMSHRGLGLLMQASLDDSERLWLQGALEGHCLQATAGYNDDDDLNLALCLEGRRIITLTAQRREGGAKYQKLASVSVGAANQSFTLVGQGCVENLWTAEARVRMLGSQIRNKLLARIQTLQRHLVEFRCQELSERPYCLTQKAELLLVQGLREAWQVWRRGSLRHALTDTLPLCLGSLQHVAQQVQQELKRPLTTLAGVYQDVTGRWLYMEWHGATTLWARKLVELLPAVLEDPHLSVPLKAVLGTLTTVLDMVSQQTIQWTEAKVATALTGIRRRLGSLYRLSKRRCEVRVQVPLPREPWSEIGGARLTEFLLEEWLLKPLQALTSVRPLAELYWLKRRLMDSPFNHQALFVSNQFVVSFDGHLYEIPGRCAHLLAHDVVQDSFTVLSPDMAPQRMLLVEMGNTTVSISPEGQVEVNCRIMDAPVSHNEVTIRREPNIIEVSNQDGALVTCDFSQALCSLTLDGWQHGISAGLLGTNDNEAGNELPLPDGSQANGLAHFIHSWQVRPQCRSESGKTGLCSNTSRHNLTTDVTRCVSLFSSPDSPLSPCFRVVDPMQFLSVCKRRRCASIPDKVPCRLAVAFVHLCNRNYVPLELPQQCGPY